MLTEITTELVKEENGTLQVEIVLGDDVFKLISDDQFLGEWDVLFQLCPWATVFQSREFVLTWYRLYQHRYIPIVIKAEQHNKLTGLLTLAMPTHKTRGKAFIVGAGHHEADYQTWLAYSDNSNEFISAALSALMEQYPHKDLMLRHLPPRTPLQWVQDTAYWKKRCVLYPLTRPLVVMSDFSISKRDRKRVNRLKSISKFERIMDIGEFSAALDELAIYYDFRQGAMFNKNPFRDDPTNKEFLISLFRQQLLHVTVMKSKDEVIAAVASLIIKNRANLGGINFHSPLYANYSPGFVHFLLLGQQFVDEGIESFDLTPGGDAYKNRLATQHDQVHILVVTNSRSYHVKRYIKKWIFQRITRIGIRTMSLELYLRRQLYFVKERGLFAELSKRLGSIWQKDKTAVFKGVLTTKNLKTAVTAKKNCLGDLLEYEMKDSQLTRWEFLEDAMRRFESGEQVYTHADSEKLLLCAWSCNTKVGLPEKHIADDIAPREDEIVFHSLYIHPDGLQLFNDFITSVLQEISGNHTQISVCFLASMTEQHVCNALEQAGYKQNS